MQNYVANMIKTICVNVGEVEIPVVVKQTIDTYNGWLNHFHQVSGLSWSHYEMFI